MEQFLRKLKTIFNILLICSGCIIVCSSVFAGTGTARLYNITISGTVSGWSFTRTGVLLLGDTPITKVTVNGVNPKEIAIISGNIATGGRGVIQFTTNSIWINGSRTLKDLAYVTLSNNCVYVRPDDRLTYVGINSFWVGGSLISSVPYLIDYGSINICPSSDYKRISGSINLFGTAYYTGRASYKATITGYYVRSITYTTY